MESELSRISCRYLGGWLASLKEHDGVRIVVIHRDREEEAPAANFHLPGLGPESPRGRDWRVSDLLT